MQKRLIDPKTGEEHMVFLVGKSLDSDKGFAKVFVAFLRDVVEDQDISGKAVRLLLYIIDKLDWNSLEVVIFPDEVIRELKVKRATFYTWLKILIEKGYIQKVRTHRYRLKPYSVIKGSMHKVSDDELVGFG